MVLCTEVAKEAVDLSTMCNGAGDEREVEESHVSIHLKVRLALV